MEGKVERNLKGFRKLLVYKLTDELHKSEIYQSESLRAETGYLLYRLEQSLKKST